MKTELKKEIVEILCYAIKVLDYELARDRIEQEYYDEMIHSLCILNPTELNYWAEQMSQGEE